MKSESFIRVDKNPVLAKKFHVDILDDSRKFMKAKDEVAILKLMI